ncbi:hypothetical protein OF117_03375 [Geodermatophilus sp. YIM 151500]|uniref:hypothetical protein n=1 Tax=Geodermatophilus sp. YIM 151500 TaxID=2984531 RepID=UPI0021E50BA4|nr:hypothetical protein [Geodermatophilus sp. YIM 151500]MCV2488392.1 hypothetical protein [Geodermatophilus sp. YIM 151500]
MTESSGAMRPDRDDELDDPGRDPVGLHPPRDVLSAPGGVTGEGGYTPGRPSEDEQQAGSEPDEPATGTRDGGP